MPDEKDRNHATITENHVSAGESATPAETSPPEAPPLERRRRPRISTTPPTPPPPPRLDDYEPIIGRSQLDELHFLARSLRTKTVKMVNSTAVGGGVAEMLNRLVPLLNELEIATKWDVITGGNDFFEVTKGFHNALHGGDYVLTKQAMEVFMMYNEQNRKRMEFPEDLFVIHDPQPAGLISSREANRGRWIWRCHIDLSNPHPDVWGFLRPLVEQYDSAIFSSPAFSRRLAQLRHASVGPRRRHPQRAGATGPQEPSDHANLHARRHRGPARSVSAGAPAGEMT